VACSRGTVTFFFLLHRLLYDKTEEDHEPPTARIMAQASRRPITAEFHGGCRAGPCRVYGGKCH